MIQATTKDIISDAITATYKDAPLVVLNQPLNNNAIAVPEYPKLVLIYT
jgi:hypothetical protein